MANLRRVFPWVCAALVLLGVFVGVPLLSASRGLERAWRAVLSDVEDGDWAAFEAKLAPNYRDNFGATRPESIRRFKLARQQFLSLSISREQIETSLDSSGRAATTKALIRLRGTGVGGAAQAMDSAGRTTEPVIFKWQRPSWKPWDWQLVLIEHREAAELFNSLERQAAALGL
jgi:hypothetical protein